MRIWIKNSFHHFLGLTHFLPLTHCLALTHFLALGHFLARAHFLALTHFSALIHFLSLTHFVEATVKAWTEILLLCFTKICHTFCNFCFQTSVKHVFFIFWTPCIFCIFNLNFWVCLNYSTLYIQSYFCFTNSNLSTSGRCCVFVKLGVIFCAFNFYWYCSHIFIFSCRF